MRKKDLRELINRKTEAIIYQDDISSGWTEQELDGDHQIDSLIELAAMLKDVLVPVQSPSLRPRVRRALETYSRPEVLLKPAVGLPLVWILLAIAGSIISLISVILIMIRRIRLADRQRLRSHVRAG